MSEDEWLRQWNIIPASTTTTIPTRNMQTATSPYRFQTHTAVSLAEGPSFHHHHQWPNAYTSLGTLSFSSQEARIAVQGNTQALGKYNTLQCNKGPSQTSPRIHHLNSVNRSHEVKPEGLRLHNQAHTTDRATVLQFLATQAVPEGTRRQELSIKASIASMVAMDARPSNSNQYNEEIAGSNRPMENTTVKTRRAATIGGEPRIIRRQAGAAAGKDRHSKVKTAKGIRDRRVRLSVSTALQFYDIQDRLGFQLPSQVFEWLMAHAKPAIAQLPPAALTPDAYHDVHKNPMVFPSTTSSADHRIALENPSCWPDSASRAHQEEHISIGFNVASRCSMENSEINW